ncbi:MAG: hypothetical protein AAF572_20100 [Cyanobacteria bacterium P01_B01_bin.77]
MAIRIAHEAVLAVEERPKLGKVANEYEVASRASGEVVSDR